jgi:uncharacterized membrane protein
MTPSAASRLRAGMRLIMAAFFTGGFVLHLASTDALLQITPAWVPFPGAVVYATGVAELAGVVALLVPRLRWWAGVALAIYVIAVWPANIMQAVEHIVLPPIPDSWWYHGPRIAAQPVIAWWALFCAGVIDWPLRRQRGRG